MLKIFRILILFSITPAILYGPALPDTSLKYIHLRKSLTTFSPTKKNLSQWVQGWDFSFVGDTLI